MAAWDLPEDDPDYGDDDVRRMRRLRLVVAVVAALVIAALVLEVVSLVL